MIGASIGPGWSMPKFVKVALCYGMVMVGLAATVACGATSKPMSPNDPASPLKLERRIALPDVAGHIDHLAIDLPHHILYVAEIANGTVDAVDLEAGRVVGRIAGLHEPQGIGVSTDGQQIVVACGDGTVHFYATRDRHEIASLSLGDDADDVRIDPRNGHAVIGYGAGGLAVIDMATLRVISRLILPGHPEGFGLLGPRVFINIPDRGAIVEGDIDTSRITASWPTGLHRLNFPIAVDPVKQTLAVAYRFPSALQFRSAHDGTVQATVGACGDADDTFFDGDHIYLVCGGGYVDVRSTVHPEASAQRVKTSPGARTGLFAPELKTLFVATPARGESAAIWVLHIF